MSKFLAKHEFKSDGKVLLKAAFSDTKIIGIVKKDGAITEFLDKAIAYVYLGKKEELDFYKLNKLFKKLFVSIKRDYQVDLATFVSPMISLEKVYFEFYTTYNYVQSPLWTNKKEPKKIEYHLSVLMPENFADKHYSEAKRLSSAIEFAREMQITPPNIANSEWLAEKYHEKVQAKGKNLEIKILNKSDIEKQQMNLLLSVNRGSTYEPRVVVIEYNGNPESKEKTVIVGKGITFDSGGYNLKPDQFMRNMKFDMSGSAIAVAAIVAASREGVKKNFAVVVPLTDNRVNGDANIPDAVIRSKAGISVEITNTDAEGRLVLADAITYALEELKATEIVNIATLTGAIKVALGETYTGVFASKDQNWMQFQQAANWAHELVWRLPMDVKFLEPSQKSPVADLMNADYTGLGGSISAAMFVHEFAKTVPHIHLDIAGTAKTGNEMTGVMVKTLYKYLIQ